MASPTTVHADGLVLAVASTTTDLHEAQALSLEVAWQDRPADVRITPRAHLLLQDAGLHGSGAITSATSQDGPHVATAYAGNSNEGDLLPFATGAWNTDAGTPDPDPDDLLLRLVRTGSLYDSAEWAWKLDRNAGDQWVGMDDLRWQHKPENPFNVTSVLGGNPAVVHSVTHQRTVLALAAGAGFIKIAWRSHSSGAWNVYDLNVGTARNPRPLTGMSMVELPDGSLRLFFLYNPATFGISFNDCDAWGSVDGGETWVLVKERIVSDILGAPGDVQDIKVAASGDWMRLELWQATASFGLLSACSSDRGATWQVVRATPDGNDGATTDNAAAWAFDLAAVDQQGTFLRVRYPTGIKLLYELGARDGAWASITSTTAGAFSAPSLNVRGIWCAGAAGRVYTLVLYDDGAGSQGWSVGSFIIPSTRIAAGWDLSGNPRDGWARWGYTDWLQWKGGGAFTPKSGMLAWAGDRLLLFTMQLDRVGAASYGAPSLTQFGGPSQRPLRLPQNTHTDAFRLWRVSWMAPLGPPIGTGASANTPWLGGTGGTFTIDSRAERMDAAVDTGGQFSWRESTPIASLTRHLGDDGVVQWVTGAKPGGRGIDDTRPAMTPTDLRNPRWGATAQSGSRHAGLTAQVAVHLWADGGFALYDVAAATTLYEGAPGTLAGITQGDPYEFRIGMAETQVLERVGPDLQFAELSWAKNGEGTAWARSGVHTLSSGVGVGVVEVVEFGTFRAVAADTDTSWRECAYAAGSSGGAQDHMIGSLAQMPFSNPGIMRGFDCIPFSTSAAQGTAVRWGGAGGFEGDTFRVPIEWERGAGQMLGASPAVVWASTTGITQQVVMDAEKVEGAGWRWQHSGLAMLGGNARRYEVEYAEDGAFTTPSRFWLDGIRAQVQLAAPLGGKLYRITGAALGSWRDAELVGWHLHAAGATRTAIIQHNAGDVLRLRLDGTEADHGLVAGATLQLWAPDQHHLFKDYPLGVQVRSVTAGLTNVFPRYMRITWEGEATAGRPHGGIWQLGRLQAGLTLPISVPMDWQSQDDSEVPNVDLQTVGSGKRTAYRQGPPRRTLQGTSLGDVDRWRIAFRSTVRSLAGYSQHPIVLCTDDQQLHLRSLYARLTSSTELANAGWRYNRSTGRWEQVGDLRMTFQQEV